MENEIRVKFFAMYLGQKVFSKTHWDGALEPLFTSWLEQSKYPDTFLQLRSIADLTDGEALVLARFIYGDKIVSYSRACQAIIYVKVRLDQGVRARYITGGKLTGQQVDYLRSIGILLPFCYLNEQNEPITLTIEQIIEKEWAQIKKP